MGSEIFYCSACGTLLRGRDFEKGKAFRFADRVSCDRCVDQVLGPVSPEEKARLLASARSSSSSSSGIHPVPAPAPESQRTRQSDTGRFRQPPSSRTPREALPPLPRSSGNGVWIGVGVAVSVLVVGAIAASTAAKPPQPPRTEPRTTSVEVVPEPLPPAPSPAPVREPRPRPPAPPVRREESAKALLEAARAHAASKPEDLQGLLERATQAQLEADGTALAPEAKALVEDARRRIREKSEAELAALDSKLSDAIGRAAFGEAGQALAAAKLPADAAAAREQRLDQAARARWTELRPTLEAARRRGSDAEAKAIADRVRAWARPAILAELDRDLAAAVERELPKEVVEYRKRWAAATAQLLPFDYASALAELSKPAEGAAKEEAAADLAALQLAAEAAREATALLTRWIRGMTVKVERMEADGSRTSIEGKVWRATAHELELSTPWGIESIPLVWLAPSTVGEIFASRASKKPSDALAAALLCALEGDLEGAARFEASLPDKFKAAAAAVAAERASGPESEARRLFADAEADFQLRASRLGSGPKFASLLSAHAGSRLARRLKPLLEERAEQSRETVLGAEFFAPGGAFRWQESSKERPEAFVSAAEQPGNFLEIEAWIPADPALRAWAYIGACCLETASFRFQAQELQGGTAKEPVSCEPGSPNALPVRVTLSLRARHASHGGPKEPSRWGWVPLPLPKYATAGPRRIRLVTDQQGFGAAFVYLSAGRGSPPRDAELRELEKNRPAVEAPPPVGTFSRDQYDNINGHLVAELTAAPAFPDRPSSSGTITALEGPTFVADQYGSRLRGYVHPPVTGNYVFFLVSDDESELWISADDSPARKRMLLRVVVSIGTRDWDNPNARRSDPVPLRAGRRYYIEVLHKDGGGNDHVSVGWQLPDGVLERPIPGSRLSPWGSPGVARPRSRPAQGTLVRAVSTLPAAVTVDGIAFEGKNVAHVDWGLGQGFENQGVPLTPPADGDKARMIRSSWWRREGLGVSVGNLSSGDYSVFLWFWEDNGSQTFDVFLNDHKVRDRYASGPAGNWERLGPFPAVPGADGRIWIRTSSGADANLSAIEIWKSIR